MLLCRLRFLNSAAWSARGSNAHCPYEKNRKFRPDDGKDGVPVWTVRAMRLCLSCDHAFVSDDWQCPSCGRSPKQIGGHLCFAPDLAMANDGFPVEGHALMPSLDNEHFWRKTRNRIFVWALGRYFPEAPSLLEIGSGNGAVLRAFRNAFPELDVWGSDLYVTGLSGIEENVPGTTVFQVDARRLPFRDDFGVVAAFDVLEHVTEDLEVLAEMHKAARPGGGILITVPQHPFLWSQRDEALSHKRRYTRGELLRKVERTGFEILRVTSFITFPFPLMVLSALRNRKERDDYNPWAELSLGAPLNAFLDLVLTCERQAIKAGVSFPFGGSLFVAARRK